MVGSATWTTVPSRNAIPEPRTVAAMTQRPAGVPKRITLRRSARCSLLVALDDVRRPQLRVGRVLARRPAGPSLAEQVPALVQLDLELVEPRVLGLGPPADR